MLRKYPTLHVGQMCDGSTEFRRGAGSHWRSRGQVKPLAVSGFSLVEVLIASVLLLMIALGIIPLFVRAVGMNQEGRSASMVAAAASSEVERLKAAAFNSPVMTIPAGEDEILFEQWQSEARGEWIDEGTWIPGDGFAFHMTTRIRQFSLFSLGDNQLDEAELISGDVGFSDPALVQLKEIVVHVESGNFPGSVSKEITLRSLRSI